MIVFVNFVVSGYSVCLYQCFFVDDNRKLRLMKLNYYSSYWRRRRRQTTSKIAEFSSTRRKLWWKWCCLRNFIGKWGNCIHFLCAPSAWVCFNCLRPHKPDWSSSETCSTICAEWSEQSTQSLWMFI